jgi:hypothetical protein
MVPPIQRCTTFNYRRHWCKLPYIRSSSIFAPLIPIYSIHRSLQTTHAHLIRSTLTSELENSLGTIISALWKQAHRMLQSRREYRMWMAGGRFKMISGLLELYRLVRDITRAGYDRREQSLDHKWEFKMEPPQDFLTQTL